MSDMMTFPDTWEEFEKSYGFTDNEEVYTNGARLIPSFRVKQWLDHLPSVQPEIIRCKDCKWWDKEDDMLLGYCLAIKHGFYSRNWDISIRRTYPEDFFCADAELRGEEDE